jgi:hypothetical protein
VAAYLRYSSASVHSLDLLKPTLSISRYRSRVSVDLAS